MKTKLARIWSVGLTVIVLASMFLMASPVAAGTNSFTAETGTPSATGNVTIASGLSIVAMEPSADGKTIYAAVSDGTIAGLAKSTDSGATWTTLTKPSTLINISHIAVAPDDANVVIIAGDTTEVYVSNNGGSTFTIMNDAGGNITNGITNLAAIQDIAISPLDSSSTRYVAVAGTDNAAVGEGCIFYFNLGATAPTWKNAVYTGTAGFTTGSADNGTAYVAVAFSPNFPSDQVMLSLSVNSTNIKYHVASFNQKKWDNLIFDNYPVTIETTTGAATIEAADIALDPQYLGGDDTTRIAFIGYALLDAATETGGIWRMKDTTKKELTSAGTAINRVDWNGTILVAGYYDTNQVARCEDALATTPTVLTTSSNKRIGVDDAGNDKVIVHLAGTSVYSAKSGAGAAFSTSIDNGKTWNGISLISTAFTTIMDVQVSADGNTQYMLTSGNSTLTSTEINLFRKTASWQRVFCLSSTAVDWIIRVTSDGAVVYLADRGSTTMYYSSDGGVTKWSARASRYNVQDLAVQSADVAYVAKTTSTTVSKTSNGGFTWGTEKETTNGGNINTIHVIAVDSVLVAGSGYVAYSTDGSSTWSKVTTALSTTGATCATANSLAASGYIFAATDTAATKVQRWQIGQTATVWKDLVAPVEANLGAYDITFYNNSVYVMTSNTTVAQLLRTIDPLTANAGADKWSPALASANAFNTAPQSLAISAGPKLWTIKTNGTMALYTLSDTLAPGVNIALVSPANNYRNPINPVSGGSQDIAFIWTAPTTGSLAYEVQILSADNTTILTTATRAATDLSQPSLLIGPTQTAPAALTFAPGTTYYWRVRSSSPFYSAYTPSRSFTIMPLAAAVPALLAPANGESTEATAPAFSWSPVSGTTMYRFQISAGTIFAATLDSEDVANTGVQPLITLEVGKTYFWRVKALAPVEGEWSAIGNFKVVAPFVPTPPVVIQQMPAPIINIPAPPPAQVINIPPAPTPPAPIAPAYIWAIIIIGAVLVIAVIVLIIRTRRSV